MPVDPQTRHRHRGSMGLLGAGNSVAIAISSTATIVTADPVRSHRVVPITSTVG